MAVSLKHTFQSAKADGADSSLVQPSNWNAEHILTAAAGKVLGRDTSGAGAVQELPIAVDTSGNVGIGTSSPAGTLDVVRSAADAVINITSGSNTVQIFENTAGDAYITNYTSGKSIRFSQTGAGFINFGINGSERMRIDSAGNVGIGTTNPQSALQVAGPFRAGAGPTDGTNASLTAYSDGTGISLEAFQGNSPPTKRGLWLAAYGGNVGIGTTAPAGKLDINGNYVSNITAVAASAIDCSAGNFFTKTATGALTWTVTNVPASRAYSFILELTNGGTGTQTWFSGIKWPGGTAPTLTTSGVDVLGFITDDGGTTWRGVQLMKDSK